MLEVANGRRVGDVTLISFLALNVTCVPLIRVIFARDIGVFRAGWIRVLYIIVSSLASLQLTIAVGVGCTLMCLARKSGGSLGLSNWPASAAKVCAIACVGLSLSTSSLLTLVVVYALAKYNFATVLTVGVTAILTLLGAIFSGALAYTASQDDGEDDVVFENTAEKDAQFWTAEDDAEIQSGLQY